MTTRDILAKQRVAAGGLVSPTYVSKSELQTSGTGGSFTINAPATITSGNLLIMMVGTSGSQTGTYTLPAGWTIAGQFAAAGNALIAYKTATGSEPASYTVSFSRNFTYFATIIQYSNAAYGGFSGFTDKTDNSNLAPLPMGANTFNKGVTLSFCTSQEASPTFVSLGGSFVTRVNNAGDTAPSLIVEELTQAGLTEYFAPTNYDLTINANSSTQTGYIYLKPPSLTTSFSSYLDEEFGVINTNVFSSAFTVTGSGTMSGDGTTQFSVNGGAYVTSATVATGNSIVVRSTTPGTYNTRITTRRVTLNDVSFLLIVDTQNWRVYTASGSFKVPWGANAVSMLAVGGGAGGSYGTSTVAKGGAGGGALSYSNSVTTTPAESLTLTIGAGGAQSNFQTTTGGAGGTTIIARGATTLVSALGGATSTTSSGGAGGAATGVGTVRFAGGTGGIVGSNCGGGGGGAGTTSGNGTTGLTGATSGGVIVGGAGGIGIQFGASSWTKVGPTLKSGTQSFPPDGVAGNPYGGGGGGGGINGGNAGQGYGLSGASGVIVFIWGGRTFSTATTY